MDGYDTLWSTWRGRWKLSCYGPGLSAQWNASSNDTHHEMRVLFHEFLARQSVRISQRPPRCEWFTSCFVKPHTEITQHVSKSGIQCCIPLRHTPSIVSFVAASRKGEVMSMPRICVKALSHKLSTAARYPARRHRIIIFKIEITNRGLS